MKKVNSRQSGFTLIEILVVIGLIAVLAAIVLIAINPGRQFALGRDSQRTSNLNAILNAIGQRMADNKGIFQGTFQIGTAIYTCNALPSSTTTIVTSGGGSGDLSCLTPTYIPTLPSDPTSGSGSNTGYSFYQESGTGRIHVFATTTEPSIPRTSELVIIR